MKFEVRSYSCYDNWTVSSNTDNISSVLDKLLRITVKVTERFASDILYDIRALEDAVRIQEHFDRVLFFCEDAVHAFTVTDGAVSLPHRHVSCIQVWRITHNPETKDTILTRVYLRAESGNESYGM